MAQREANFATMFLKLYEKEKKRFVVQPTVKRIRPCPTSSDATLCASILQMRCYAMSDSLTVYLLHADYGNFISHFP